MPLWNLAEPIMESLVERIHESCSVVVLDQTEIVYVLRVPTRQIITINLSIGSRLPAYCTPMGRVLLAALHNAQLDAVRAALPPAAHTTDADRPRRHQKGHCASANAGLGDRRSGDGMGLVSMAAPIHDRRGRVIAAMNISGHTQRSSSRQMKKNFLEPLLEAAQTASRLIAQRG